MPKLKVWMVGSISKKLRGLNAKNRAYLELLLNGGGLRVDSKETQGLFSKAARPKGVTSNLGRWIWIGRFGRVPDRTVRYERRVTDGPI
jgi:hypothetical protein